MNVALDTFLVSGAILGALAFFTARLLRLGKKSCDSGCGCDVAKKPLRPPL
jgi:hypothetical protein